MNQLSNRLSRLNHIDETQKQTIHRFYSSIQQERAEHEGSSIDSKGERDDIYEEEEEEHKHDGYNNKTSQTVKEKPVIYSPDPIPNKWREKAEQVFCELIETEYNYLDRLDDIVKLFICPLRARAELKSMKTILDLPEIDSIFLNIQSIAFRHRSFLRTLRLVETSGESFQEHFTLCREVYKPYMAGFNTSTTQLKRLRSTNTEFDELIRIAEHFSGYPIQSLLVEPIQRLPRYSLMMKELIKSMESYGKADIQSLVHAHDTLLQVVEELEQVSMIADRKHRLLEVEQAFVDPISLASPHRLWLCEGEVLKYSRSNTLKPWKLFLLSDCIVIAKVLQGKEGLKLKERMWLKDVHVDEGGKILSRDLVSSIIGGNSGDEEMKRIFSISNTTSSMIRPYIFLARSREDQMRWVSSLRNALDTLQNSCNTW